MSSRHSGWTTGVTGGGTEEWHVVAEATDYTRSDRSAPTLRRDILSAIHPEEFIYLRNQVSQALRHTGK
jgi:hypothetical protein